MSKGTEKAEIEAALASSGQVNAAWMPVGRSGWHSEMREQLLAEIRSESMRRPLLKAGFAHGTEEFLELCLTNFSRIAQRMEWW